MKHFSFSLWRVEQPASGHEPDEHEADHGLAQERTDRENDGGNRDQDGNAKVKYVSQNLSP
jgi:hypothetical protein